MIRYLKRSSFLKYKPRKVKLYLLLIAFLLLALLIQQTYKSTAKNRLASEERGNLISVTLPYVVVHIDLKGAPPKLSYLTSLVDDLKRFGVNGLLIEYEDMFPYEGRLERLRSPDYYKKEQLKKFLTKATSSGFEVIPLVQTFGHMEYVLKLKEFRHMREKPSDSRDICPSRNESYVLIEEMLKQIIEFHSSIIELKHLHIGCDEVYNLNKCDSCRNRRLTKIELYVRHVEAVTGIVRKLNHDTKILFWDDMLRQIDLKQWTKIHLRTDLEPVYWQYSSKFNLSHISLFNYHRRLDNIWIASAFKGADGRFATLPNVTNRFKNHFHWMNQILGYKFGGENQVFVFKGIILTGWSRYTHFAPHCELLPPSIPSLIINLLLIQRFREGLPSKKTDWFQFYKKDLKRDVEEVLQCDVNLKTYDFTKCSFEGKDLYDVLRNISNVNKGKTKSKHKLTGLKKMREKLEAEMAKYYSNNVIEEYINYKYSGNNTTRTIKNVSIVLNSTKGQYYFKRYNN